MAVPLASIPDLDFLHGGDSHDEKFSTYIRGINNATEHNHVFSVADTPDANLFNETGPSNRRGKQMYMRDSYVDFLQQLWLYWFPPAVVPPARQLESVPVVVTGTGGTGKTSLRNILCKRLLDHIGNDLPNIGDRQSIVFQNGAEPVFYHAQFERSVSNVIQVRCTRDLNLSRRYVDDIAHCVYYLIDAPKGNVSSTSTYDQVSKDRVVFFFSPNEALVKSLRKTDKVATMYMPLWTIDELLQANTVLRLDIAAHRVRQRFKDLGGVARHVLEVDSGAAERHMEQTIIAGILSMEVPTSVHAISYTDSLGPEVCRLEVPRNADNSYDFTKGKNVWASKFILLLIAERVADILRMALNAETSIFDNQFNSTISGYVYESYAIHLLKVNRLTSMQLQQLKKVDDALSTIVRRTRRALGAAPAAPQFMRKFDQNRGTKTVKC